MGIYRRVFTDAVVLQGKVKALAASFPIPIPHHVPPPGGKFSSREKIQQLVLATDEIHKFATGASNPTTVTWVKNNATKFAVQYSTLRDDMYFFVEGKSDTVTNFMKAGKHAGLVKTDLPDWRRERKPPPGNGTRAHVAQDNQNNSQQHQTLPVTSADNPLPKPAVLPVSYSHPNHQGMGVANIANIASTRSNLSFFANRGPTSWRSSSTSAHKSQGHHACEQEFDGETC